MCGVHTRLLVLPYMLTTDHCVAVFVCRRPCHRTCACAPPGPGWPTHDIETFNLPSPRALHHPEQVAEVCVGALTEAASANKVVEVIAEKEAPARTLKELFSAVTW